MKFILFLLLLVMFTGFAFGDVYADHSEVTIIPASGSGAPGCEDTSQGCYIPGTATVDVGGVVIFSNTDSAAHTFTSINSDGISNGIFDSGLAMAGSEYTWTPTQAGEVPYYCMVHPWMQGLIIVQELESDDSQYLCDSSYPDFCILENSPDLDCDEISHTNFTVYPPDPHGFDGDSDGIGCEDPSTGTPILSGTDITIPSGTGSPGCEESFSCYSPFRFSTSTGDAVTWFNSDSAAHTVTSVASDGSPNGVFDSGLFMSGNSFSHTFDRSGTYDYFCMVHPWMTGKVLVSGSNDTPTPTPTRDTTPPKILKPTDITVDAENNNGANVSYDVLAIDETDQLVRSLCTPSSGSMFVVGTTKVTCNASDSAGNRAQSVSFSVTVNAPALAIPEWVKNIAAFWCDDKIDNASFIEGIQYLIDNDIIIVFTNTSGTGGSQDVPQWVKNSACWWSEGLISDIDFASGIEYLVNNEIIRVNPTSDSDANFPDEESEPILLG